MWQQFRQLVFVTSLSALLLAASHLQAQKLSSKNSSQDSLTVTISNISIAGESSLRGLTGGFPYPILSTISLTGNDGMPVIGLADTAHWLGPNDLAEIGAPISEIWRTLLEYHRDNPAFPADPNLYFQVPPPLFTEVRETTQLPTSTMLVMDASNSMRDQFEDAKEGARLYVELMRPSDATGLVIFAAFISSYQPLTNDQQQLIATINSARLTSGTALYDAILFAIAQLKAVGGRRGIIAYTDGIDISSVSTPATVIDSANASGIPVFTIALGANTREEALQRIATETGGLFFKAATVKELSAIYTQLSDLIQNYYVMAHASPDPVRNNTWRTVAIDVNAPHAPGHGTGQYLVPGPTAEAATDLGLQLQSLTPKHVVIAGDTLNAAQPGDVYQYLINVRNFGPVATDTVTIYQLLPDSVHLVSASQPLAFIDGELLVWQLVNFEPGAVSTIPLTVQFSPQAASDQVELISHVHIQAKNDTSLTNNFAADTIRVVLPNLNNDLALSLEAITDTTIVIAGEPVQAVVAGEKYRYDVRITNRGPKTARELTLWNIIPDSASFSNFTFTPSAQKADTLFWEFDSLATDETITLAFDAIISTAIPFTPFPVFTTAHVQAAHDTLSENNSASATVFAIRRAGAPPMPTDVAVSLTSRTDSIAVIAGKLRNAVTPGELYSYEITLENFGTDRARNLRLVHRLPDSVRFNTASIPPLLADADSLLWQFRRVEARSRFTITVSVQLSPLVPPSEPLLFSTASISAENDTFIVNNLARDTTGVFFPERPGKNYDLVLHANVISDTSIMVAGKFEPAVIAGESYSQNLLLGNHGPGTARNFTLQNVIPPYVTLSRFTRPPTMQRADTLLWRFDSLASGASVAIAFDATVTQSLPFVPFPLFNQAQVFAPQDTATNNNFVNTTIYGVKPRGGTAGPTDMAVSLAAMTDTTIVFEGMSFDAVRPGEFYQYEITLRNLGREPAHNVRMRQLLPDSVRFIEASLPPFARHADSLMWVFDSFEPQTEFILTILVQASLETPFAELNSRIDITADNDTSAANNVALNTVRVLFDRFPASQFDLLLTQEALTDTTILVAGATEPAVLRGASYSYRLEIRNLGPGVARDIELWDAMPDSVTLFDFDRPPASRVLNTYFWEFDTLAAGERLTLSFRARVSEALNISPFPLLNSSKVTAINDIRPENNLATTTVYAVIPGAGLPTANVDLTVIQSARTDSFTVIDGDTLRFVRAGETYSYTITVSNDSSEAAQNVVVRDMLPDSVSLSFFESQPEVVTGDSLRWQLGYLLPRTSARLWFKTTVSRDMPRGRNLLINRVEVRAANEPASVQGNNAAIDTVFNLVGISGELLPLITASPPVVEIGNQVAVRVQVQEPIQSWDLWVYWADGGIDSTYADEFVVTTLLAPDQWYDVQPTYKDTRLRTAAAEEPLTFEIRTKNIFRELKTAQAEVTVRSSNDFVLDRNLFEPGSGDPLAVKFKLSTNRAARLDVYDIAGSHITRLADAYYEAGWNNYIWNGSVDNGKQIGSGLYMITLSSGDYHAMKKVMVVR